MIAKTKIKKGDKVRIVCGKDNGKEGKVLLVDRKKGRVVVEGLNMIQKHQKARGPQAQGGIVSKEAPLDISNVMYLHKGKPTRIGYQTEVKEVEGKTVRIKHRFAKSTGELID